MVNTVCIGLIVSLCWQPQPRAVDSYCEVYRPIIIPRSVIMSLSTEDAARIVRPIIRENRKWKRLCGKRAGKRRRP